MKTKNLVIIFILFLLITLFSGLAVFYTGEKEQSVSNQISGVVISGNLPVAEKPGEIIEDKPASAEIAVVKPIVQPEKVAPTETGVGRAEQIQAVMLISSVEYRIAMKPGSSVYDLMNVLKEQKKIDFKAINYAGLGFFVEEINGIKNNPAGKNWIYYVNSKPAPVGVSYYLIKANDIIEWKYEKKSF